MDAMRHRRSLLIDSVVFAAAVFAAPLAGHADDAQAPGVLLRYQFQPGQKLYYSVVNGSNIVVQYDVNQYEVAHSSASVRHFRVIDVYENGNALLQLTIDRAYMRAEQAGSVAVYDSASNEPVPDEFAQVNNTIGVPWVNITVSPRGEVLDVRTMVAGVDDANVTNEVQNNVLSLLPEEPVQVGGSWSEEYVVGVQIDTMSTLQREIRMQRTFTLTAIDNGRATIEMRTVSLSPVRDPFQEGQLLQRTPSGTLELDIASGALLSRGLEVDGEAVGFSGPQSCMTVDSTRTERLIDADDMDAFFAQQITVQAAATETEEATPQ
jgi:hypothetical protein